MQKIKTAELIWQNVDGVSIPISKQFGDVYFSKDNGLLETRYVFLQGNDLKERLSQLDDFQCFCVGETGFGTGLNVLALWQLWQQVRPHNTSRLHIMSIEKYPLRSEDLKRALSIWPELSELVQKLIEVYPLPIAGCHRLNFPHERLSIDLWLGDAVDIFPKIVTYKAVDAWFLDGFAPSCNPDFWQDAILKQIIRLSAEGTTFASFTVAGVVKRGLVQHGIHVTRPKGFGRKREMLKAIWPSSNQDSQCVIKNQKCIAIIGAGIAGLSCAYALAQRGYQVQLYDKNQPVTGASGNPLALLNPKLCAIDQADEHLMVSSWQYALRFYTQFAAFKALKIHQLQLQPDQNIQQLESEYPTEILSTQLLADTLSQYPQLTLLYAGAVKPQQLAEQILQHDHINFCQTKIDKIECIQDKVNLYAQNSVVGQFDDIIICSAKQSAELVQPYPTLKAIRGQVSWCDANIISLQEAYSYSGYCAQLDDQQLILGATFKPHCEDTTVLFEDHQHNLTLFQKAMLSNHLPPIDTWHGRASIRAQTADYFPIAGQVSRHIYTLAGLGSKGFLFAPLCAEMIIAQLLGEPIPMPYTLYQKLLPQRFKCMRKLILE